MQIINPQPPIFVEPPLFIEPTNTNPAIRGDPAALRFGIILLIVLGLGIIASGLGIGLGNISHYRYFSPTNSTYTQNYSSINESVLVSARSADIIPDQEPAPVEPVAEPIKEPEIPRKTREFWLSINKP